MIISLLMACKQLSEFEKKKGQLVAYNHVGLSLVDIAKKLNRRQLMFSSKNTKVVFVV